MPVVSSTLIELDARGVALVSGTRMKVKLLASVKKMAGWSPEEIQEQYPFLSLAQIYAALAYYYENQAVMDEQIARDEREVEELRKQGVDSEIHRRLVALKYQPHD